jgi:hypothetical protein
MEVDIIVAIGLAAVALFFIAQVARTIRSNGTHRTLRKAIEQGQPLSPELIEQFDRAPAPGAADQRIGFVLIALALALFGAGAIAGGQDSDNFKALAAIALFPLFVGIALLLRLRLTARNGGE